MDIAIPFDHHTTANCETGVMFNLMRNKGYSISEDLIFGIGSGLYFIYFPFIQMGNDGPLTSYRYSPGSILKNASKRLGVNFDIKTYKNVDESMKALDDKLAEGIPVGLSGDLYEFEVFPEFVNFHFNNHNLVIFGKEGDEYLASDPIVDIPIKLHKDKIEKARFVKGAKDNPKGRMYWINQDKQVDLPLEKAVFDGLNMTCNRMLNPFFPFGGVKGIQRLSKKLKKYPQEKSQEYINVHLTNMIRHQEIVGSGGSGYRIQFARFLKEAGEVLNNSAVSDLAAALQADIVPAWREYSLNMARCARSKKEKVQDKFIALGNELSVIGDKEKVFFNSLKKAIK